MAEDDILTILRNKETTAPVSTAPNPVEQDDSSDQILDFVRKKQPPTLTQPATPASAGLVPIPEVKPIRTEQDDKADALGANLFAAAGNNPQEEADRRRVAKILDIDPAVLPETGKMEAFLQQNDPQRLVRDHPGLAKFLSNASNAAVTGTDIPALRDMNQTLRRLTADPLIALAKGAVEIPKTALGLSEITNAILMPWINLVFPTGQRAAVQESIGQQLPEWAADALFKQNPGRGLKAAQDELSNLYSPAQKEAMKEVQQAKGFADTFLAAVGNPSAIGQITAESLAPIFMGAGVAQQLIRQSAGRLTAMAASAAGEGTVIAGSVAAKISEDQKWKPLEPGQAVLALGAGAAGGAIGYVGSRILQRLGVDDVDVALARGTLQQAAQASGMPGGLASKIILSGVGEGLLQEMPQSVVEQVAENVATGKPWDEGVPESAALGMLAGTAMGAGGTAVQGVAEKITKPVPQGGLNKPLEDAVAEALDKTIKAARAEEHRAVLDVFSKQAANDPLRSRSKEAFQEFVTTMTDEEPELVKEVFVAAKVLDEALAQSGISKEDLERDMPEVARELKIARDTGSEVRVSTEDYATHLAGTAGEQQLLDNLRTSPEGMTYIEAQAYHQEQTQQLTEQAKRILAENSPVLSKRDFEDQNPEGSYVDYLRGHENKVEAFAQDANTVHERILDGLNTAGRFNRATNAIYAVPFREFFITNAAKAGIMPSELYARYPLNFSRMDVSGLLSQPTATTPATPEDFTPDNLDGILNKSDWVILTSDNPNATPLSEEENTAAREKLKRDLDAQGLKYDTVMGRYEGDPGEVPSFIVYGVDRNAAIDFARKYGQQSVLTNEGLVYQNGSVTAAQGVRKFTNAEEGLAVGGYTRLPGTDTLFQVDLDWKGESYHVTHFAHLPLPTLSGLFAMRGLPGADNERVRNALDKRIRRYVDFYTDVGKGIIPESGLGNVRHDTVVRNIYNADVNAEGFGGSLNDFESQVLDAGYAGYFQTRGDGVGRVRVLGDAAKSIDVEEINGRPVGREARVLSRQAREDIFSREADGSLKGLPRNVGGFQASHWPQAEEVARNYMAAAGLPYERPNTYVKVDKKRAERIAKAFTFMRHTPNNPEVKAAYEALVKETAAQYQAVVDSGLVVEFITGEDPYAGNPRAMTEDVRNNNHMWVFSTRDGFGTSQDFDPADNPLLGETEFEISGQKALVNDLFRVVHDYFGHVKEGVGFRADGEENAWRAHMSMFSPLAGRALTTETRGQNSWVNFGPFGEKNRTASAEDTHFADQKIGLLPEWVSIEGVTDEIPADFKPPEFLFQFAGSGATTADLNSLARARELYDEGVLDDETIRQETGWFKGRDGKWRFEIDDHLASLKGSGTFAEIYGNVPSDKVVLSDVLDHPRLFEAYPGLANLEVRLSDDPSVSASIFSRGRDNLWIELSPLLPADKALSSLLHEVQHGIQNIEGFASGGSESDIQKNMLNFIPESILERMANTEAFQSLTNDEERAQFIDAFAKRELGSAYSVYRRLAGEVEARNVQTRAGLSELERRLLPPSMTADIPAEDILVTFNGVVADNAPVPVNAVQGTSLPDTIDIDGTIRSTRNSEGVYIAATEEGVRNFWKWFGDSKIVDGSGRPLVIYHGTGENFDTFIPGAEIKAIFASPSSAFSAHYTHKKTDEDKDRTGANIMPVYFRSNNPFDATNGEHMAAVRDYIMAHNKIEDGLISYEVLVSSGEMMPRLDEVESTLSDLADTANRPGNWLQMEKPYVQQAIRALGFDGFTVKERGLNNLAVYEPTQVKSAIGNVGRFDITKPSVLEQEQRASFNPATFTISLLNSSDLSSTIHEGAHFYLEVLADMASKPDAPKQIVDDFRKTLEWFGITGQAAPAAEPLKTPRVTAYPRTAGEPVSTFTDVEKMKAHKDYAAAKAGDDQAAFNLVNDLITEENLQEAKDKWAGAVFVPVQLLDKDGANRIPTGMAYHYANAVGGSVSDQIFEARKAFHTGMNAMERLISRAEFTGAVVPGQKYVLVDDVTTIGSTLADLASYITQNGGIVVGSALLTNATRKGTMFAPDKTIKRLEAQYGTEIRELFGIEPSALTGEEAQYLLGFRTSDELKRAAAKAEVSRKQRILSRQVPASRELLTPEAVWASMTLDQKRPFHEQWAQSFERYAMEGKAPTIAMQSVFARFRSWMLGVYKSVREFLKQNPLAGKLNDDIRGVFDRLLAAEDAIKETEKLREFMPLFGSPEEAGITLEEYEDYLNAGEAATQKAITELGSRSLRDMRWLSGARDRAIKALQKEADNKREIIRGEVTAEVMAEPVNRARTFFKTGEFTNDRGEVQTVDVTAKLDIDAVKSILPEADLKALKGMTEKGGMHPDLASKLFGYRSGEELVNALARDELAENKIAGLVDQRMLEQHGDLVDEQAIKRAADEAVHNDARARFMATGLKLLQKSPVSARKIATAAKQAAESAIAGKRVRDLHPGVYTRAESTANRLAIASAAKEPAKAIREQRKALLNNRLAKATQEAVREVEAALKYFAKFQNESTRKVLGVQYTEQIDDLLRGFDFKKRSLRQIDKNKSLNDWIQDQIANGFEPAIDAARMDELKFKNYKDMTVEELRGLRDAVKQIEQLGRLKNKLLTARDKREFAARMAEAIDSIRNNANRTVKERATATSVLGKLGEFSRWMAAIHRKFSSVIREMDGSKDGGVMWELLSRPMNEAGNNEAEMNQQAAVEIARLFKALPKEGTVAGNLYTKRKLIPGVGISMSQEERVTFALNWGNEGNRQRLLDGGLVGKKALSLAEAEAVLDTLTKEEWDFVQGTWDFIGSYKDEIAALEARLTGVQPEWVEPTPVVTKFGTYRGGYYPAKYDTKLSSRSEAFEVASDLRMGMKGAFNAAATKSGHVQARAAEVVNRPILLSYNVISSHVSEVVHRLAWQPWVVDANRVLRALDEPIREHYGPEILRELRDTVSDIAAGDMAAKGPLETAANHLRVGATITGMGWKLSTALLQPTGLAQSWARVGGKWVAKGIAQYSASPLDSVKKVQERSLFMKNRAVTMQREVNEVLNTIRSGEGVSNLTASYFTFMAKMQRVADIPTWIGAYEKALAQSGYESAGSEAQRKELEDKAVALADQAVLDSQSGGQIKDLAKVQRGSPIHRLFTNFYSYFSATYNLNIEAVRRTNFKSPTEVGLLAVDLILLNVVPVLFSVAFKQLIKGGCDPDDLECLAGTLAKEQASFMFGQMILLREAGAGITAAFDDKGFGYQGPAGLRFFSDLYKAGQQVGQGELDWPAVKTAITATGGLLHFPAGQINATLEGIMAVENGDVEGIQILPALMFGPPKE